MEVVLLLSLGAFAGLMAGLLGIGGGIIVVPGLAIIFRQMGVPTDVLMHFAAGTSLCIMIFTAITSASSHHRYGNIDWELLKKMVWGAAIGAIIGAVIARLLPSHGLAIVFGLFLIFTGIKMLLPKPHQHQEVAHQVTPKRARIFGGLVGVPSGMLGVGGGMFTVPLLTHYGVNIKKATGVSAALTFPISIVGSATFLILGLGGPHVPWSTGYINWLAVLEVAPLSMLLAPVGARLTKVLPAAILRRIFGVLILLISLQMLWGALHATVSAL